MRLVQQELASITLYRYLQRAQLQPTLLQRLLEQAGIAFQHLSHSVAVRHDVGVDSAVADRDRHAQFTQVFRLQLQGHTAGTALAGHCLDLPCDLASHLSRRHIRGSASRLLRAMHHRCYFRPLYTV